MFVLVASICAIPRAPDQLAKDTFAAHRANYHSICAKMVARDLGM